jgi:hypothetical protein
LNAKNAIELAEDEKAIVDLFRQSEVIDVTAVTSEFDLAVLVGQNAGVAQCIQIYPRCRYEANNLMGLTRPHSACRTRWVAWSRSQYDNFKRICDLRQISTTFAL